MCFIKLENATLEKVPATLTTDLELAPVQFFESAPALTALTKICLIVFPKSHWANSGVSF
jgi:hypothetical protein